MWDREDLLQHTEPKHGYTRTSRTFLDFIDVLCDMDAEQRKVRGVLALAHGVAAVAL